MDKKGKKGEKMSAAESKEDVTFLEKYAFDYFAGMHYSDLLQCVNNIVRLEGHTFSLFRKNHENYEEYHVVGEKLAWNDWGKLIDVITSPSMSWEDLHRFAREVCIAACINPRTRGKKILVDLRLENKEVVFEIRGWKPGDPDNDRQGRPRANEDIDEEEGSKGNVEHMNNSQTPFTGIGGAPFGPTSCGVPEPASMQNLSGPQSIPPEGNNPNMRICWDFNSPRGCTFINCQLIHTSASNVPISATTRTPPQIPLLNLGNGTERPDNQEEEDPNEHANEQGGKEDNLAEPKELEKYESPSTLNEEKDKSNNDTNEQGEDKDNEADPGELIENPTSSSVPDSRKRKRQTTSEPSEPKAPEAPKKSKEPNGSSVSKGSKSLVKPIGSRVSKGVKKVRKDRKPEVPREIVYESRLLSLAEYKRRW